MVMVTWTRLRVYSNTLSATLVAVSSLSFWGQWALALRNLYTFAPPPPKRTVTKVHCIGEEVHRGVVVVLICGVLLPQVCAWAD